jgi:olefin beta-lactone synthetase
LIGSPVFFEKIADYCLKRKCTVPVRRIFLGGAPVFPESAEKLMKVSGNAMIEIVYGSTEAEPIAFIGAEELTALSQNTDGKGLPVGKPAREISLVIMKIDDAPWGVVNGVDREKRRCACGETGEICVCGDHVLKEYVNCPDAQAENKFQMNGTVWHRTGDAGYLDTIGNLFLMGRVKQRISYGDNIIFPFTVEMALQRMKGVRCGTLLQAGGKIVCVVEPSGKKKLYISDIVTELSGRCKISVDCTFVMPIPRDPRHRSKIDYIKLEQMVAKLMSRQQGDR